jgi:hypothetical protein
VSRLGKPVHERGFHFFDCRRGEGARGGDLTPVARSLRNLGKHMAGLITAKAIRGNRLV